GIKKVPTENLIPEKTYLFFSHTKKQQPRNRKLLRAVLDKKITLIDYECLEHEDGQRIIGFGFFAGVVGAHNGMMAYGNRTGSYQLERVNRKTRFRRLLKKPMLKNRISTSRPLRPLLTIWADPCQSISATNRLRSPCAA